ncbi:MAG: TetR/AcrR family transcriptional regulator [Myxococcaceae bacterium]|nr:TetR/AcrR family transcriptional regulator [Myxococcaceae bacterium]
MPRRSKPARETYHHGDLRNALVTAAVELVEGSSPEELTLREVSRRVGVNHRAAYRHFKDKTALLAAVAEDGYRALLDAMDQALAKAPRTNAEERLMALAVAYVSFAIDQPARYRIMFGRRLNEDGRFPTLEELVGRAYAVLAGELRAGQVSRQFHLTPVRELVFGFWSLTHGFASLAIVRRLKVKRSLLDAWTRTVFAPFVHGLAR